MKKTKRKFVSRKANTESYEVQGQWVRSAHSPRPVYSVRLVFKQRNYTVVLEEGGRRESFYRSIPGYVFRFEESEDRIRMLPIDVLVGSWIQEINEKAEEDAIELMSAPSPWFLKQILTREVPDDA